MDVNRFVRWVAATVVALGAATAAQADLRTTYTLGPVVFPGGSVPSVRAVAVDNNINSAWYGCVFVADAGGPTTAPQRRVMIFRPDPASDGTGGTAYVDTGVTISVPDQTGGNGVQFAPFGVYVGPDDTVWVANYDDRTVETIALPASIPAAGSLGSTTIQFKMADFDAEAKTSSGNTAAGPAGASPRAIFVNGPITAANVFLGNYDGTTKAAQRYTVVAPDASTTGVADHIYTTLVTTSIGPYGIAADAANNAYVPVRTATGGAAIEKLNPEGVRDTTTFTGNLPAGYADSPYASIAFTHDASMPGGGYLYYSFRNGTTGNTVVLRYDLNGNYLDGFGAAGTTSIPNFTPLSITGSTTQYVASDDQGNVYQRYVNGANSAVIKINKKAPFVTESAATNSAGAAVKSSPTAVDGVVYFGADDGKLYAYTTADGNPVAGFPVDVATAAGAAVKVQSRAAVYITSAGKGIYFTTDRGDVGRVSADGSGLALYSAFAPGAGNVGTPAVQPDGTVFVGVAGANGLYVLRLNPDMTFGASSPQLGPPSGAISSLAVNANKVYAGLTGGTSGDLVVLDLTTLAPLSSGIAAGEGVTAPPYVNGINMYAGTLAGNFYKLNSATAAPDPTFGALNTPATAGFAAIGEPLPGSAFAAGSAVGSILYVGSAKGKLWQVNSLDGSFNAAYDTGDPAAEIPGLVVDRDTNVVAFGSTAGVFYQFPVGGTNAQVSRGYGAFHTTPTLDQSTGRFLIGSDDQNVYAFSSR